MANEFKIKNGLISDGDIVVTGSISATGGINIPGSIESAETASFAPSYTLTSSFNSYTSSASSSLGELSGSVATTTSDLSSSIGSLSGSVATTTSGLAGRITTVEGNYATTGSNTFIGSQVITGSLYITTDLIVQGSSSLQNITASAVSIGTNTVILNTDTPAVRFAGVSVQDSGSNIGVTGSIFWDGLCNRWIYSNPTGVGYAGGMFLSGPRSSQLGSESPLTCNYVAKSGGGDHLYDSCIVDDGTTVCINATLKSSGQVCGVMGTFSCAGIGTDAPAGKLSISATGADGIVLSPDLNDANNSARMFLIRTGGEGWALMNNAGNLSIRSGAIAGSTSGTQKLGITTAGVSTFSCQVCTPHLVASNNISIGSSCTSTSGYNTRLRITDIANDTFVFAFNNQACKPIMQMYGGNTNNPQGYTTWLDNTTDNLNHVISHNTAEATYFASQGGNVGIGTSSLVTTCTNGALTIVKKHNLDTPPSTTAQCYYCNQSGLYIFGRNSGISLISSTNEESRIQFASPSSEWFAAIGATTLNSAVGGTLYFRTGASNSNRFYIDNVGISYFSCQVCTPFLSVGDGTQCNADDAPLTIKRGVAFAGLDFKSLRTTGNIGGTRFHDCAGVVQAQQLVEVDGSFNFYNATSSNRLKITSTGISCFACQVCAPNAVITNCLGIGAVPASGYILDVYQPAGATTAYARIKNNRSRNAALQLETNCGNFLVGVGIGTDTNRFQIYDNTCGENRLVIDSVGNVGLGSNSPAAKLDVRGDGLFIKTTTSNTNIGGPVISIGDTTSEVGMTGGIAFTELLGTNANTVTMGMYYDGIANRFHFTGPSDAQSSAGANLVCATKHLTIIRDNGNVGIGASSPGYALTIQRNGDSRIHFSSNGCYDGSSLEITGGGSSDSFGNGNSAFRIRSVITAVSGKATGNLGFWTNCGDMLLERLHISCNGSVGIGTSTPSSGYKLDVNGTIRVNDGSQIQIGSLSEQYPYRRIDSYEHDGSGYFWGFGVKHGPTQKINAFFVGQERTFHVVDSLKIVRWVSNEYNGGYPSYSAPIHISACSTTYINNGAQFIIGRTSFCDSFSFANTETCNGQTWLGPLHMGNSGGGISAAPLYCDNGGKRWSIGWNSGDMNSMTNYNNCTPFLLNWGINGDNAPADRKFCFNYSGNAYASGGTWGTLSSNCVIKTCITGASSQWNDVKNICIVNYKMKEEIEEFGAGARIHLGVVAEQVESVSPGLLENSGYSQKWCTCLNGVKTSILYMKAVKALQEAMCRIEVLESCLGMS